MLNKEEEQKVVAFLENIAKFSNLDAQMAHWMTAREFQWLATRVIELNEELKKVQAEIDRNNAVPEVYKNPKNEISDRFYPR